MLVLETREGKDKINRDWLQKHQLCIAVTRLERGPCRPSLKYPFINMGDEFLSDIKDHSITRLQKIWCLF